MPAGQWEVQTQLIAIADGSLYNIDHGVFTADNFITRVGSIFQTTNTETTLSSYMTYNSPTVYTFSFTLSQYVPQGGFIQIDLPDTHLEVQTNPPLDAWQGFFTNDPSIGKSSFTRKQIVLSALNKIEAGPKIVSIGGIRNPKSFDPTDVFEISSFKKEGQQVGRGILSNVRMN